MPSGWLSDRYGARLMLVIYIVSWSFFTAMIGAVHSLAMLLLARLGCGLGQAGAYPTSASIVSKWVPFSQRGMASALIAFGGRIGGALAPLLTAYLIVQFLPADTSPFFTESQLLEPAGLAVQLAADSEKPTPQSIIFQKLPPKTQELCKSISPDQTLSESEKQNLLEGLNHVVGSEGFYDEDAFRSVNLVREALNLLKEKRGGESLSEAQQRRLNRFLIEGVFPHDVGKLYTPGWRPVMIVYGGVGIAVALLFWVAVRDRPEAHPWCNAAECEMIAFGRPAGAPSPHGKTGMIPWKPLLSSGSMWLCCLMQVGTNLGWAFLVMWLPRYLMDVHHVPILERGLMTSIPLMVGFAGMLGGGRLTDAMTGWLGVRWGRGLPMMLTRFTGALGYFIVLWLAMLPDGSAFKSPWYFVAAFSLVAFSTDMGTAATWAFSQDVGGRYVGSFLGWGNMWGNLGAAVSPLVYNYYLGEHPGLGNWNATFLVCALAFMFAGLCGLGIDASKPIAPPDEDELPAE